MTFNTMIRPIVPTEDINISNQVTNFYLIFKKRQSNVLKLLGTVVFSKHYSNTNKMVHLLGTSFSHGFDVLVGIYSLCGIDSKLIVMKEHVQNNTGFGLFYVFQFAHFILPIRMTL